MTLVVEVTTVEVVKWIVVDEETGDTIDGPFDSEAEAREAMASVSEDVS